MRQHGSEATDLKRVYLDLTHTGRHVTGIERIAIELFEKANFRGADVQAVRAGNVPLMILKQQLLFPLLALLHPRAVFLFPGFPPSPLMIFARSRVVLYVHDCFLITRRADLGLKAKLYMAWPFRRAVAGLRYFMTNSEKTRRELQPFVAADAQIALYRPCVRNVFDLAAGDRATRPSRPAPLKLVALGTVEPRKNYRAALAVLDALATIGHADAELHIIGRPGWGADAEALAAHSRVTMHGYLSTTDAKRVIEASDLYLCTSHDEGLGLPLLEVQFAGLPVVAPDAPVFREVLGASGTFIDAADAAGAAQRIARIMTAPDWRRATATAALANVTAWNEAAGADAARAESLFERGLHEAIAAEPLAIS